jgi:hypothetical protein
MRDRVTDDYRFVSGGEGKEWVGAHGRCQQNKCQAKAHGSVAKIERAGNGARLFPKKIEGWKAPAGPPLRVL